MARALTALPQVVAALGEGRMSYAQVRAISRVATALDEQEWVALARFTTGAQLERLARGVRRARKPDEDAQVLFCSRHHTLVHEGLFVVRLDPDRTLNVTDGEGTPIPHLPQLPGFPARHLGVAGRGTTPDPATLPEADASGVRRRVEADRRTRALGTLLDPTGRIDADTLVSGLGDRMDLGYAVSVLVQQAA